MSITGTSNINSARFIQKAELDQIQEWENHLIIRFPPEIAQKIRDFLNEDSHHGNSRMHLNFNSNLRTGTISFDRHEMEFSLYDLPSITEVMKTLDNKTLYKVADISQIIVCSSPGVKIIQNNSEKDAGDSYEWPHGLCPPMRNAQRKRFRKTKKKKYMDAADVERELKRLLRSDLDSVSVRWEVVSADEPEMCAELQNFHSDIDDGSNQPTLDEYGLSLSESDEDL